MARYVVAHTPLLRFVVACSLSVLYNKNSQQVIEVGSEPMAFSLSVYLCVCVSIKSRCSIETAERNELIFGTEEFSKLIIGYYFTKLSSLLACDSDSQLL